MDKKTIFQSLQHIEFVLTYLSWGDDLQPGELEAARDKAREIIQSLYAEDNTISE